VEPLRYTLEVIVREGPIVGFRDPFGQPLWAYHKMYEVSVSNQFASSHNFFEAVEEVNESIAKMTRLMNDLGIVVHYKVRSCHHVFFQEFIAE
jgi:hypothetical protein